MNREEFIDTLRRALYGKVDDYALADHVRYYENYISQEIAKGRSEGDVLEELGDPRLIARTILETSGARTSYQEYTVVDENGEEQREENERIRVRRYEGWKARLLLAGILLVIFLILILVFHVIVALFPFRIVAGIIVWIVRRI